MAVQGGSSTGIPVWLTDGHPKPSRKKYPEVTDSQFVWIEFHCLLHTQQWGFDQTSKVYILFAAKELGDFKYCHGPMKRVKDTHIGGYLELSYSVKIPMSLLKSHSSFRRYKYCVDSVATRAGIVNSVEFISGPTTKRGDVIDRCLKLHVSIQQGCTYEVYDGILWPEMAKNPGYGERLFNWVTGEKSTVAAFKEKIVDVKKLFPRDHIQYRNDTLKIYLGMLNDIVTGKCRSDPIQFVRMVHTIFSSVDDCSLFYDHSDHSWNFEMETRQQMYDSLLDVTRSLVTERINVNPNATCFIEVLILLMIYYKCSLLTRFCSDKSNQYWLRNLLGHLVIDESYFQEGNQKFLLNYKKSVVDILTIAIDKCSPHISEWIFAVPLMHFITEQCQPYEELESIIWGQDDLRRKTRQQQGNTAKFNWGDSGLLQNVSIRQQSFSDYLADLQSQFQVDPLLIRFVVKKTSIANLPLLVGKVPLFLLPLRLAQEYDQYKKSEIIKVLPDLLGKLRHYGKPIFQSEKDTATVKSCFNFFETVTKNINKYDKELVILTIELVLFVLSSDIQLQSIHDEVSSKLEALLKATISKMFTRTYGGTSAENQFWDSLTQLKTSFSPWQDIIRNVFGSSLPDVTKPQKTISLLLKLDANTTSTVVLSCLIDHIFQGIECGIQLDSRLANSLEKLAKHHHHLSGRVLLILNKLMLKRYSGFGSSEQITIAELFNWELWPTILKIFVNSCSAMNDIESSSKIAHSALVAFHEWCDNIIDGKITMSELAKYENQRIEEYCNAANSGIKQYCPDYSQVSSAVELCHRKFQYIKQCCEKLKTVVEYCSHISTKLTKSISDKITCDLEGKEISSMCVMTRENQFEFVYLSKNELPPREMLENLVVLGKEYKSCFFEHFWNQNSADLSAKANDDDVSFQRIISGVWKPTISNCESLLREFHNRSMKIEEMKKYGSLKVIGNHLNALCSGIHKCHPHSTSFPAPGIWIQQVVNHIDMIMKVFGDVNVNIAEYCLSLKESLGLEGNFTKLMELNQMTTSFEHVTLAEISMQKLKLFEEVNEAYSDASLHKFFDTFVQALPLIEWLRTVTNGPVQLESFTTVCKAVCDFKEKERLTKLLSVGENFSFLIYDLPRSTGFDDFFYQCRKVTSIVKDNSRLIRSMEECGTCLEWYKSLAQHVGSFHSKANNSLLYSPPETRVTNYVNVEFFCLLSAKQWDFDDRTSNVYLRFAANAMGTFTTCHGPMSPSNSGNNKRDGGKYFEYHFTVKVPQQVLTSKNAADRRYRYHVESSATAKGLLESLEVISGPKSSYGEIDRSLKPHSDEIACKSVYQKFDGIILPKHKTAPTKFNTGLVGSLHSGYRQAVGYGDKCEGEKLSSFNYEVRNLSESNHKQLRKNALWMHLEDRCSTLSGTEAMNNPIKCIEMVLTTYESLNRYHLCYKTYYDSNPKDNSWMFDDTKEEMNRWLSHVIKSLADNIEKSTKEPFLQNMLAMLIICSKLQMLDEVCNDSKHSFSLKVLLRNIAVDFSSSYHIVQLLQSQFGNVILKTITTVVNCVTSYSTQFTEWIFAVPILHLLNESCEPFQCLDSIDWDHYSKCHNTFRNKKYYNVDISDFHELQFMFDVDPLLLRLFVKKLQVGDLPALFAKVPTSVILMRLAEECASKIESSVYNPLDMLHKALSDEMWIPFKSEEDITIAKAALYFLELVVNHYSINKSFIIDVIIKLLLLAISRTNASQESYKIVLDNATKRLINIISSASTKICGRSIFNVGHRTHRKKEMEYWTEMLNIKCEDCVKEFWCSICSEIITSRLTQLKVKETVTVLTEIDEKTHDMVTSCILNHLIDDNQQVGQQDLGNTEVLKELRSLVKNQTLCNKVLAVLNKLLHTTYPNFSSSKRLQVQELIAWKFWPSLIEIFIVGCDNGYDLKSNSKIVYAAITEMKQLLTNLTEGAVTKADLEHCNSHDSELKAICEAANSGKNKYCSPFSKISQAMKVCFDKLDYTEKYHSQLTVAMEYTKPISVEYEDSSDDDDDDMLGNLSASEEPDCEEPVSSSTLSPVAIPEVTQTRKKCSTSKPVELICKELSDHQNQLQSKQICKLCTGNDAGSFKCICFTTGNLADEMIKNCIEIGKCGDDCNQLFQYYWKQNVNALNKTNLTDDNFFTVVHSEVWGPTISCCKSLLCELHDRSITLVKLEELAEIEFFSNHLYELCSAMQHCYHDFTNVPPPDQWIPQLIKRIEQYQEISTNVQCNDAANLIVNLRKSLHLTGDFEIIENLANSMEPDFKKQSLDKIDDNIVNTWEDIKEVYTNQALRSCLNIYAVNTGLVEWLKETANDVSQLVSFIEICSSTAGEEEFNMTRLSYLHSVGTGFAALIYELPMDADFKIFNEKCTTVRSFLMNNPRLEDTLRECNNHLEWFKELKATQGSIEVAAITRVKDVNDCGKYIISSSEKKVLLSIGDAITLKIRRSNAVKTEYSLDDLHDLESKLVLITGKDTAGKNETDKFLNHLRYVRRIATALLALQNAGHARYTVWQYTFYCDCDVESALRKQAKTMESELQRWTDEIVYLRKRYHALNYFTTQQLHVIRQKLGQLDCNTISHLPPEVLSMLMSISCQINEEVVLSTLKDRKGEDFDDSLSNHKLVGNKESLVTSNGNANIADQVNPDNEVSIENAIEKKLKILCDQLSEVERETFDELKEAYQDLEAIVYLGIKYSTDKSDENLTEKALEWCVENESRYVDMEKQTLLEELNSCSVLKSEDSASMNSSVQDSSLLNGSAVQNDNSADIAETEQKVIEFGFESGLAREAAMLHPNDVEKAVEYCLNVDNASVTNSLLFRSVVTGALNEAGDDKRKNPYTEEYDEVKVKEYIDLKRLAVVLEQLVNTLPAKVPKPRYFHNFKPGEPNLVLVSSGIVLKATLSIYCDMQQTFPSMEEVVICTSQTSTEDVVLLWRRALKDPGYKQVFCLVYAEKISYKVCDESIAELTKLSQGNKDYRIVIICSLESEQSSHVVSKLLQYKRDFTLLRKDEELSRYVKHLLKQNDEDLSDDLRYLLRGPHSKPLDPEDLTVRVVLSRRPGMGKSLHVKNLPGEMRKKISCPIIPIHGPKVDFNTVTQLLHPFTPSYQSPSYQIIHIDIDSEVLSVIDTILFSLVILKSLKDTNGNVWRVVPSQLYMLEITFGHENSIENVADQHESIFSLLRLLPSVLCASPVESLDKKGEVAFDKEEFKKDAFQLVARYLKWLDSTEDLSKIEIPDYSTCISTIKKYCGLDDPSWATLSQFVRFLHVQLSDCEGSIFCNDEYFEGPNGSSVFKQFIVGFMIRMSTDFGLPSLKAVKNHDHNSSETKFHEIKEDRKWDKSKHPYIFFNQDHMTMTFIGFKVNDEYQCTDPKSGEVIEGCDVPENVFKGILTQGVNLKKDDTNSWNKKQMIERLCRVIGVDYPEDPDDSYVLTTDNLLKMMAIHMRFRCNIPVVIMGETGCGKTRLIRYMCDLQHHETSGSNLVMLKVHGGTSVKDITDAVNKTEDLAKKNYKRNENLYTILFFDEANTTENIGLIKEIMCDRRLNGVPISDNVKFIAACNPYRKHTKAMITKLEAAGLGYYVKAESTQHRFGNIPLRHLVYRVLDLPLSMQPLLYDFGQVAGKTEDDYITQIVTNHVRHCRQLSQHHDANNLIKVIAKLLAESQSFMRSKKDECSFVSLRDVERAMIVFKWFFRNNSTFEEFLKTDQNKNVGCETRSMIMTLAVCYHARIQAQDEAKHHTKTGARDEFEEHICGHFTSPMKNIDKKKFQQEISSFQDMILSQMKPVIPKNIAHNVALKENVFMMLVCIELKIPLFVIGKPGSSKSLAKSIIENSMQGTSSTVPLCRKFKQVKLFSYQCSQHSTPDSILEIFSNAQKFQESKDIKQFVSVVVLDEVGLAEDSPSLPLKALHPLLEDGTSGADTSAQQIAREHRVAFVGISNWALDPAKMNRGVMITRGSPDEQELKESARGICSTEDKDLIRDQLEPFFVPLAKAYLKICEQQKREFFGLRDFYSLIKMLYWMVKETERIDENGFPIYSPPTEKQLIHAVQRNFDGLDEFNTTEIFLSHIPIFNKTDTTEKGTENIKVECDALELIEASLKTKDTSWHGQSRYLLFMTENFAALRVLQQHLLQDEKDPPFVLFGSSFPKDMEYTQVCRNINQIKICMETGRTAILLNLENLYESLYDVLNQYYTILRENRYVDLGLQSHRIKCRVDNNFKMILIAEKKTVYADFPTPLINRLEKHFVVTSTVLTKIQMEIMNRLTQWAKDFTAISNPKKIDLKLGDTFVGYQEDTTASVVFQAYHNLQERESNSEISEDSMKEQAFQEGKQLLLNIASPDAVLRLKYSKLSNEFQTAFETYFNRQCHNSLIDLLDSKLRTLRTQSSSSSLSSEESKGLLLQVTTHSHLLSDPDVTKLCKALNLGKKNVACYLLQEFDTEMDFCNKLKQAMQQQVEGDNILIIQCDSGHLHSNLIACARYKVIDEIVLSKSQADDKSQFDVSINQDQNSEAVVSKFDSSFKNSDGSSPHAVHVVFIIQLPRKSGGTNFVGFQGGNWISVHLDDLRAQKDKEISFQDSVQLSVSEIFKNSCQQVAIQPSEVNPELTLNILQPVTLSRYGIQPVPFNANRRLRDLIQLACSLLYDTEQNRARTTERIEILTDLVPSKPTKGFDYKLVKFVSAVLKEMDDKLPQAKEWAFKVALNHSQIGGTFRNALSRRLDEILLPILAKIIGLIDKNYNLTIIHDNRDSEKIASPIAKIWLEIMSDRNLCKITYEDVFTDGVRKQRTLIPGIGASRSDHFYKCQFPFSWICRSVINSRKCDAALLAGTKAPDTTLQMKTMELVQQSSLGAVLNENVVPNDEEVQEELCSLYLNDYIVAVYLPSMDDEHKLVYAAVQSRFNSLVTKPSTFLEKLVVLHLAYHEVEPQLQQFKQLVSFSPQIVSSLQNNLNDYRNEISDLALCAVRLLVKKLEFNNSWNVALIKDWIIEIAYYQTSIVSVLHLKAFSDASDTKDKWKKILALKSFAIIVGLHYKVKFVTDSMKRMCLFLKNPDFKSAKTLKQITSVLTNLQKNMRSSHWKLENADPNDEDKEDDFCDYFDFINRCERFFIEIISCLCFEHTYDSKNPSQDLIDYLMSCVYAESGSTQRLSPFLDEEQRDAAPVIRSYLLKLLIGVKADTTDSLKDYFDESRKHAENNDKDFYVLCIQCFEDEHYKSVVRYNETKEVAEKCLYLLKNNFDKSCSIFSVEKIKAVAAVRYCLSQLADTLSQLLQNENEKALTKDWKEVVEYIQGKFTLLEAKYPAEYFIKYIVRQYGIEVFSTLRISYPWIVPEQLDSKKPKDDCVISPALVYHKSEDYNTLSDAITAFIYSSDSTLLDKTLKKLGTHNNSAMIIMAVYANIALKITSVKIKEVKELPSEEIREEKPTSEEIEEEKKLTSEKIKKVAEHLEKSITNSTTFNDDLKQVAKDILEGNYNELIERKTNVKYTPRSRQIIEILLHCVSVLLQREDVPLLKLFVELLKTPSSFKGSFLPTMLIPDKDQVVSDPLLGSYYTCKNPVKPHTFPKITDDCGKDGEEVKCHYCNEVAHKCDISEIITIVIVTGHNLGTVEARGNEPEVIRDLTAARCSVIRVLLHSVLTWSSCFKTDLSCFSEFVTPDVVHDKLPRFFWRHLEKDLTLLASSLNRNFDDAVLIIHLLLRKMSQMPAKEFPDLGDDDWSSNEHRTAWENKISKILLNDDQVDKSFIETIDKELKDLYGLIIKDTDTLYSRIYERAEDNNEQSAVHSAFWRYRTRVSLEHLFNSLNNKENKILYRFLQQEPILRAMQYLPGILKLQKYMFDHFHQQVGQERSLDGTIGKYKETLTDDKEMFTEMVEMLNGAWLLVKGHLSTHGRLPVDPKIINDVPEITDDTKLVYLLPTTTGEGICSTSLVDFLVVQHNEFIRHCYNNIPATSYDPEPTCKKLMEQATLLSQLQPCHVISYENKLLPLILTYCQYYLQYGKGTEVEYDATAIESDLFGKFIFGKPLILIDEMPIVVLSNDDTFYESIVAKVHQEDLSFEKKKNLVVEINKLKYQELSEVVDVIDIVLRFLASAGGEPDKTIYVYVTKTLAMHKKLPKLVKECILENVISLWGVVSVVQCCQLTMLGKDPFYGLDKAYCDPIDKTVLQQTFRKIESTINFLIALHNFIVVHVNNVSPNPQRRLTEEWSAVIEASCIQLKVDLKSVSIPGKVKICHVADVWKQAVEQLWKKET